MQYFEPADDRFFVGDCMPFFHEGRFHLFYLLDEDHHRALDGAGGHQWAHASSQDLLFWEHHPLAVALGNKGEYDALSICTGSVFYHAGTFYAFYSTRMYENGQQRQHICLATSQDGISFSKSPLNPLVSPAREYALQNFRDPCLLYDAETELFHMLVSASLAQPEQEELAGCLAHLVSTDLSHWILQEPFIDHLKGSSTSADCPECPDWFEWNGWYYLLFSLQSIAHYRMSRSPWGPWIEPAVDTFDGLQACVLKTATFTGGRRLGVAFLSTPATTQDDGGWLYAGKALFRELIQHEDGTLGCCWPEEMWPVHGEEVSLQGPSFRSESHSVQLRQNDGRIITTLTDVPINAYISLDILSDTQVQAFGICFRGNESQEPDYELRFIPGEERVLLYSVKKPHVLLELHNVTGLQQRFAVQIAMRDDIIDVCIDQRRTLCARFPEARGSVFALFCENGGMTFSNIKIAPLLLEKTSDA